MWQRIIDVTDTEDSPACEPILSATSATAKVGGDEVLYRLLFPSWVSVDQITGERRPTSAAFEPDDEGLSIYRETILIEHGLGASDLTRSPSDPVVGFTAADVRSLGLRVIPDAWPKDVPDLTHPKHAAHALIRGLEQLGRNPQLRKRRELAKMSSLKFVQG